MRIILRTGFIVYLVFSLLTLNSCKKGEPPVVVTTEVINVTGTSATSGGNITSEGSGTVLSRGICWSTGITPTINDNITSEGAGAGSFSSTIDGLNGASTYYLRAYATNNAGIGYGMTMSFTTMGGFPSATTNQATYITDNSAILNGSVNPNYLPATVSFEYGTSVSYGLTANPDISLLTGNSITAVTAELVGLDEGTIYHFRIKATNSMGTTYGNDLIFSTIGTGRLVDIEGNVYKTIIIGTQTWMKENLRTTTYNDGQPIPLVTDATEWKNLSTPAYCWFNNNENEYKATYGALYNWYTVNTGKLCPGGWHVPSDGEWTFLTDYLGGIYNAGGKLKEAGTTHWLSPNTGATNQSGFTALPAGIRGEEGQFTYFGVLTAFWTSTPYNELKPFYRNLNNELSSVWVGDGSLNINGFSIRCLRN